MPWIDGHLDLAWIAISGRDLRREPIAGGCLSLPALRQGGVEMALGTIFTEPGGDGPGGYRAGDAQGAAAAARRQLDLYRQLEGEGAIALVRRRADLDGARSGPLRVVLLMEGADAIRSPEDAAAWYANGLRAVGLTWAAGSRHAGGNRRPGPLTAEGIALVRALDALGAIHDVSHLCDEALDDLLAETRGPVVATHSNCRALVADDQRHLRDDQIDEIGRRGGVIGLNLFSRFLVPRGRATIGHCVAHVQRVAQRMGHRRGVGLGSDMDGGFGPEELPEGLDHPARLGALAEALRREHWAPHDVEGFMHGNWRRFLERALPE